MSFDSKNSLNQTVAVDPALFMASSVSALALALSDHAVLVFKLTFLPSGAHCRAGTLPTIRHIPVLRMLWWVSPGCLCCRATGLRDIS